MRFDSARRDVPIKPIHRVDRLRQRLPFERTVSRVARCSIPGSTHGRACMSSHPTGSSETVVIAAGR
jgi:hypothetical protein